MLSKGHHTRAGTGPLVRCSALQHASAELRQALNELPADSFATWA